MCELTYVNITNQKIAPFIAYSLVFVDSDSNKDGVGIHAGGKIWKTHIGASSCTNVFPNIRSLASKGGPIMAHTRAAGFSLNNVKSVTDSNAHPFVGERFVLMHNGTLTYREGISKEMREKIGPMTDSEWFLKKLEENVKEGLSFAEIFNNTMSLFYGKFAFLIHDMTDGQTYAIRGSSASLHKVNIVDPDGKVIGYVINTVKSDLVTGLVLGMNLCMSHFDFNDGEIEELKKETIYNVTDPENMVEVATCKENFYTAPTTGAHNRTHGGYGTSGTSGMSTTKTSTETPLFPGLLGSGKESPKHDSSVPTKSAFVSRLEQLGLTFRQIDLVIRRILNKSSLSLEESEWKELDTLHLPLLNAAIKPQSIEIWKDIVPYVRYMPSLVYESGRVCFPYFIEEPIKLEQLLEELKSEEVKYESKGETARNVLANREIRDAISESLT